MIKFIAEHVPAYEIEPWADQPWRDEDRGLSAPEILGRFDTEDLARQALVQDLTKIADLYWSKAFDSNSYHADYLQVSAAATVIKAGSTGVKVHGRYYRVRPVEVKA